MNLETREFKKKELLAYFDDTLLDLLQALSSFNEEELNTVPFEGSWTAGQVAEHLIKSDRGITKLLLGNTEPTKRRADEKVKAIESIFLDFTKKVKSVPMIQPSAEHKEKEKIRDALNVTMNEIRKIVDSVDLSLTCLDFRPPTLGEFTRWEWINLIICHTKRHIYQIKNILKFFEAHQNAES